MARLLVPASLIAAMLCVGRSDLPLVRADEQTPVTYIEEASPTAARSNEADSDEDSPMADLATENSLSGDSATEDSATGHAATGDSTSGQASETELGEPNPITDGAEGAGKLGPATEGEPELEVIHERYPNRAVKIERQVSQDEDGNYVNDGSWRMWDQKGTLVVEGNYRNGQREGVWNRWYYSSEVELLTKAPYSSFMGPFISQATFVDGKLDGNWTIYDSKQHKISQFEFVEGQREGRFTWWFATGRKMREIEYVHGEIDGQRIEWSIDGKVLIKETFQHGRKLANRLERDAAGDKKSEGQYLFAKEVEKTPEDWWNARLATFVKQGRDEKHGPWVSWYPKGQRHSEGEYRNDVQIGKFTWWYSNGQKALEGAYTDGEQQGKWVWWHQNGQKSIQGEYSKGHPSGHWTWWSEDGKVARSTEMETGAGEVVVLPEKSQPHPAARSGARTLGPNYHPVR